MYLQDLGRSGGLAGGGGRGLRLLRHAVCAVASWLLTCTVITRSVRLRLSLLPSAPDTRAGRHTIQMCRLRW